ncbi:MAG: hypothetical protein AABY22_32730 [Nanoarchaeota archaeon]
MINISQERLLEFLQKHKEEKFTAKELQFFLDLGKSIYPNLKKLIDDPSCNIYYKVRISKDRKRYKEFVYYYEEISHAQLIAI